MSSIYVRFADSKRFDKKVRTGLSVNFDDWSKVKQQVKLTSSNTQKDFINRKLREIENYLLEHYNLDYNTKKHIGENWLKDKINDFFGRVDTNEEHKIYFVNWVQKFIDDCPTKTFKGEPIKKRTIQHYITTKHKLIGYEKHFKTKLRFQDIGLDFYHNFLFYCQNLEKLNNNTIGGYITNIKKWCKMIEIEGLPINLQYKSSEFSSITNKTKDIYLTDEEINKIFEFDFSYSDRLDNVRDNFIIGLRTGLRISDFSRLEKVNIVGGFIEINTIKTSTTVVIAMHRQVKAILKKRNGEFPRKIEDQKFNEYVKEVCKAVGMTEMIEGAKMVNKKDDKDFFPDSKIITKNKSRKEFGVFPKYELISSHICRRSFASNLYGQTDNMSIMAITGHSTESQFLKYIKITPKEHAIKLKTLWEKENKLQNGKL